MEEPVPLQRTGEEKERKEEKSISTLSAQRSDPAPTVIRLRVVYDNLQAGSHITLVEPQCDYSQVEAVAEQCGSPLETPSTVAAKVQVRSY